VIAALLFAVAASGWQNARAIVIPPVHLPAYVRVALPQSIDAGADGSYPGVRVVDASGQEVPYALDADPAASASGPVTLSDVGFVPGEYTQAIADMGNSGTLHSSISIEASQLTFFEHVQIASSDDRSTWSILVPNALIYRVQERADDAGETTVSYGPSRARWLRIRVLDGMRAFPITAASAPVVAPAPKLIPLAGTQSVRQSGSTTVVTIDFGEPHTNLDAIAIETTTPQFDRGVLLERSGGEGEDSAWEQISSAPIARFPGKYHALGLSPTILAGSQHIRRLRVTIENRDDRPLAALHIPPLGYQHHVVFQAEPDARYRLLWNNADAVTPVYDLANLLQHQGWTVGAVATLGAPASTIFVGAGSANQVPWLQQAALPLALAFLFLVLLTVVLIAMRAKPEA